MEELLSLKWNNHRSTFLHILTILRDKQLYTDVTLACDGRFYSVHRLVLSTCSDYFSAMFDRTTCKNPIIVLKDIKCEDLEALLDYMYLGEVNVRQADLASLIKAAECLRVKGLAVPDDEPPHKRGRGDTSNLRKSDGGAGSPPSKRKRRDEGQDGREDIRPSGGSSRPKTPQSQSRLSPIPPPEGLDTNSSPNNLSSMAPQSSQDGQPTQVKVEMEDTGGGDSFNMNNESFKEEANEDQVGDMSNDLPEFLQQSGDNSYSHSFAGPSFQPDLQNWQGDQVLSSNNFSGLGFPSQSQEGTQNPSGTPSIFGLPSSSLHELFDRETFSRAVKDKSSSNPNLSSPEDLFLICSVCDKMFYGVNRKAHLRRHMVTHTGLKPHACPFCPHRTYRSENLRLHVKLKHPVNMPQDYEN